MRRYRFPLLLVAAGLVLIIIFFLQQLLTSQSDSTERSLDDSGTLATQVPGISVAPTQMLPPTNMPTDPPSPTATPTPSNTPTPTPTPTYTPTPTPTHTRTPQPLYPTRTPDSPLDEQPNIATIDVTPSPTTLIPPTATPTNTSTPMPVVTSTPLPVSCPTPDCVTRFGVSGQYDFINLALEAALPFSHYLNWQILEDPPPLEDVEFWQMVRVSQAGQVQDWEEIGRAVDAQPGSIWVVGNEPDIIWQDNVTPDRYAHIYHDVYTFIKERDSTAKVAIGGVGQPTPLRLAYLDIVLETYETTYGELMPIDVWTVHNFILREEADSWGVSIPPGMEGATGILYELEDHDDLAIFQQNLVNFRAWMAERGYADRPLALTEFGILHPWDFGFPEEVVVDFMIGAFDILMNTANETGYPADDGRLVQWWFWFSVYDALDFPTGNLYDPESDRLTTIGEVFASYVRGE